MITSVWRPDADLNKNGMQNDMQHLLLMPRLVFSVVPFLGKCGGRWNG